MLASGAVLAGVNASQKAEGNADQSKAAIKSSTLFTDLRGYKASSVSVLAKLPSSPAKMSDATQMMAKEGLSIEQRYALVPGLVRLSEKTPSARVANAGGVKALIERLERSGAFEYVEPDWQVHALAAPNDSAFVDGTLWGLRNTGQSGGVAGVDINVLSAWEQTTGSSSIVIGVVDTGVRYTHSDLSANMWVNTGEVAGNGVDDDGNGYIDDIHGINAITRSGDPMDDNDHGTHVAGTIAASGFDAGEHVGVAYTSKLMALKFLDQSGSGSTSDAIRCIEYAVAEGVDILNNSWGGGGFSQALLDAIEAANEAGVLFLAAAGNSASNNDQTPSYPANYDVDNVISVAAIDRQGNLANFSSFGATAVDIAAPGVAILSSTSNSDNSYASFNGTSMATPHVAGVAALLLSAYPGAQISELRNRLLSTAAPLAALSGRVATGGMVDAAAALDISADGVMELSVEAPSLLAGESVAIAIRVSDLEPVINATVSGGFADSTAVAFLDNGTSPDVSADDGIYTAELMAPTTGTEVTLNVNVTAPGKSPAELAVTLALIQPPVNDDFADRIMVLAGSTSSTGSNVFASAESGEPRQPAVAGGRSVWWEWSSPSGLSSATISTSGSDFDTTLAVYRGTSLGNLSLVAANDDSGGRQSAVSFTPLAGESYVVQVDGYAGASGAIQLNYPAPDGAPGAPVITTQPSPQSTLIGGSFTLEVRASGSPSPTYQWVRVENENTQPISGATSASYTVNPASESDAGLYAVVVSNSEGSITSQSVLVNVDQVGVLPPNDAFADARLLSGGSGRTSGSNLRATGQAGEPNHAGASGALASVWFYWEAPGNGDIRIDTLGSDYDTTLAVYRGSEVSALSFVAANDDAVGLQSVVDFAVQAGTVYRIAVDGFSTREGQVILNYSYTGSVAPQNDDFASRGILSSVSGAVSGSNIGAGGEVGEPNHGSASVPLASVWWSWEPDVAGDVTITTLGSDFDTTLAAYTGSFPGSLALVASNDDFSGLSSQIRFAATAGTRYALVVDGYASNEGAIALELVFEAAVRDGDGDGTPDEQDNCPEDENADQADRDGDDVGDVCDAFADNPTESSDSDGDGMGDNFENAFNLDPNDSADAGIDSDQDGSSNLEEFLEGTSPREFDPSVGLTPAMIHAAMCAGRPEANGC